MNQLVCIGQINRPHGLEGSLKITLSLPSSIEVDELIDKAIFIQGFDSSFSIKGISKMSKFWLIQLKGIDTLESAEKMRNKELYLQKEDLGKLPDNEFLIVDLIGLKVIDFETKEEIGELVEVEDIPQNSLLKIKKLSGDNFLLPMVDRYISKIDLSEKVIYLVDWLPFAELN
ncbi:MAG: ribosome maturation factor RimM [Candidatus Caenarcaniphilales bacterium]|nr:ribosome maturation factor RimM [Candidatus Caenarcaniphilales bacterium]